MKRIFALLMVLAMMLAMVACGGTKNEETTTTGETTTEATTTEETTTEETKEFTESAANAGELKAGVYTSSISYAGMGMTWDAVLTLKTDGTFVITSADAEKGAGTYALTGDCYTMTYSDERICTFATQADGSLILTSDFPFGVVKIQRALVGDIVFAYEGEASEETTGSTEQGGSAETAEIYTLSAGTYQATYEKVSQMAGTVIYNYTATIGEDGTFSYSVKFAMGETEMDGSSASGTYTLENNVFTFTDSEGNVTEGALVANNQLMISLKASAMASTPYEVTFIPAEVEIHTLKAGTYTAVYEKVSQMAGTVIYNYTAIIGEDGTFSYSVKFAMGETEMDGSSASGTYTVSGNTFTFTDTEGNVTEGFIRADDVLMISLKASAMASTPYDVIFALEA